MINEEAIEIIKIAIAEVEWNYPMDYAIAFENAISAREKQIPKKVVSQVESHAIYDNGEYIDQLDTATFKCPMCGCVLACGEIDKSDCVGIHYCDNCGQALDWSDVK